MYAPIQIGDVFYSTVTTTYFEVCGLTKTSAVFLWPDGGKSMCALLFASNRIENGFWWKVTGDENNIKPELMGII